MGSLKLPSVPFYETSLLPKKQPIPVLHILAMRIRMNTLFSTVTGRASRIIMVGG